MRSSVELLREAGNIGVGERRNRRIVLIVVLKRQGVFAGGVVVEVGDRLVADEVGRPGDERIENMRGVQGDVLRVGDEPLALFAFNRMAN